MLHVIWQIYNVINTDGSLTCGVKICSAKYFFSTLFKKYVTRVVVLKVVLSRLYVNVNQMPSFVVIFSFCFYLSLWIIGDGKHFLSLPNMPVPD